MALPNADPDITLPEVLVTPEPTETNTAGTGGQTPGVNDQAAASPTAPLVQGGGLGGYDLAGSSATPPPGGTQEAQLHPTAAIVAQKWLDAGYTPEQVSGALGGINQEAPGYNSKAQNPTSGATGLYQVLGSRQQALQDHLNKTNSDWFDPGAQTDHALSELAGTNPADDESQADRRIRAAKTPAQASAAYATHFMRPGEGLTPQYLRAAAEEANRVYPDVKQLAQERQAARAAQTNPNEFSQLATKLGIGQPAQPTGQAAQARLASTDPGSVSVPPPSNTPFGDLAARIAKDKATDPQAPTHPNIGQPQDMSAHSDIKDWLTMVPKGIARGWAEAMGFPGDMINAASDYWARHGVMDPQASQENFQMAAAMAMLGGEGGAPMMPGSPTGDPNAVGMHVPVNSKALRQGIGEGWTETPTERDTRERQAGGNVQRDLGGNLAYEGGTRDPELESKENLFNASRWIGAGLSPGGIAGRATQAGAGILNRGGSILMHDIAAPGLGGELANEAGSIVGQHGGTPQEQALAEGTIAALSMSRAGFLQAGKATLGKTSMYQKYVMNKLLKGQMGPEGVIQRASDNPAMAAANLNPIGPQQPLPERL